MRVMEEISKLKAKQRKNQCIVIIWDADGSGSQDDFVTCQYKGQTEDGIEVVDSYGHVNEIDECNFDEIKRVMLVKKDYKRKMGNMEGDKSPDTSMRHVGIELEFVSKLSRPEVAMMMVHAGVENFVTVKEDGSLDDEGDYQFTHEITVLATEREFPRVINRICKALKGNSKVNTSCGMHVHLDMRTRNPDAAYMALFEAQPVLYAMCPKSRRTGTYSKPVSNFSTFTRDAYEYHNNGDRYYGINKGAYMKHATIEVRIHSGTLLADKIINWVNLLIKIVDNPQSFNLQEAQLCRQLVQFKKRIKVRGKLAKYIDNRIEAFKSDHNRTEMALTA